MRDGAPVRRHGAAQIRQNGRGRRGPIATPRTDRTATELRITGLPGVIVDELPHLIDRPDAVHVALLLSVAPGKQAVATEDDAVAARMFLDGAPQHERQLEAGTLPGHPDDRAAVLLVELPQLFLAVRARRKRDRPVRMQVVDMVEREKGVQRRIDRRGDAVLTEGCQGIKGDHLVFVFLALVAGNQGLELVHVENREARRRNRSEIAATALHGQHARGLYRSTDREGRIWSWYCRRRNW